jgi:fructose-1,6-bisphosphatase/inositol monophosphatase family enzyme
MSDTERIGPAKEDRRQPLVCSATDEWQLLFKLQFGLNSSPMAGADATRAAYVTRGQRQLWLTSGNLRRFDCVATLGCEHKCA